MAEAKLAAPRPRTGIVQRPRILRTLDGTDGAALTLVAAPVGYGKTTAVRAWCASRDVALAWVTLDAGDNDPARLWRYVATAVDRVRGGLGRSALQRLSVTGAPIEGGAVDELMNGIAALGDELVLVLDDLQVVTDGDCLASIDYALEHLPASARLVAITRSGPAVDLPGCAPAATLAELRADELAFTVAEARELLVERSGLDLGLDEVELLRGAHRGLAGGAFLRPAVAWERRGRPISRYLSSAGDHRFVADYLANEVIGVARRRRAVVPASSLRSSAASRGTV